MSLHRPALVAASVGICLLTGCTTERVENGETIFAYAWWLPVLFGASCFAIATLGLFELRRSWWKGGLVLIVGLFLGVVAPMTVLHERVVVGPQGFRVQTGFWWIKPQVYDVKFADLARIELTSEQTVNRKNEPITLHYLLCHGHNGGVLAKIELNEFMDHTVRDGSRGAAYKIVESASEHGIEVSEK